MSAGQHQQFLLNAVGKGGGGSGREKRHFDPERIGSPERYRELQKEESDLAAFYAGI